MAKKNPVSRTYIINRLISDNNLNSYLEIGVSNPYTNYLSVKCGHKISVDPCIECEYFPRESIETFKPFITHQMTSDDFFAQNTETFDIVFIDGDHSYEQSLADLNNALKIVPVGGFVVLHDAMPIDYDSTQYSNFEKKLFYNGEVWKTTVSAIRNDDQNLLIGTFPYDFGVTVIKKLGPDVREIPYTELRYADDYSVAALNPVFDIDDFRDKKVSYFTGLFNTKSSVIERTTKCVLNQTNPNWEWVLYDDSNNAADAERLKKFFADIGDPRIKYFNFHAHRGIVGLSKKRAANLCTGDYLAELDHDDLLMPNITDMILKHGDGFDFIYSNNASVVVHDDNSFTLGEYFEPGFAMGYGSYRTTLAVNPLTGMLHEYQECIAPPINPKTIRHIVGVPNHIRVWDKKFYDKIGGHNTNLTVADDYELIVRSFLNGGRFLHLDMLGYLQVEDASRTTYGLNTEIQYLFNAVLANYDYPIKQEFERRGMEDWAYKYMIENIGFDCDLYNTYNMYKYYDVPTYLEVPNISTKI